MQNVFNYLLIQIVRQIRGLCNVIIPVMNSWMSTSESTNVVLECEASLVSGFTSILQGCLTNKVVIEDIAKHVDIVSSNCSWVFSVKVVPEEVLLEIHDLVPSIIARRCSHRGSIEKLNAFVGDPLLIKVNWDDVKVHQKLWVHWPNIRGPISSSITNHDTSQVILDIVWVIKIPYLGLLIVLVYLPGKVWCVNSTVALTTDEDLIILLVWSVLREPEIPLLKCLEGVL